MGFFGSLFVALLAGRDKAVVDALGSLVQLEVLLPLLFVGLLSLATVVVIDIAVLALALCVVHAILVLALSGLPLAAKPVVAVVAHALREVLEVHVGAAHNFAWLAATALSVPGLLIALKHDFVCRVRGSCLIILSSGNVFPFRTDLPSAQLLLRLRARLAVLICKEVLLRVSSGTKLEFRGILVAPIARSETDT